MTRRCYRIILAACMVATVAACDDDDLLVQVALNGGLPLVEAFQAPNFALEGEDPEESIRIWYEFTNRTDRTLFLLTGCDTPAVDRLEGDEWVQVWPPPGLFCTLEETPVHWLAPGEPFGDLFEVDPGDLWTTGDYRMRLLVFAEGKRRGETQENPIRLPLRVSPPFTLEVPLREGSPGG